MVEQRSRQPSPDPPLHVAASWDANIFLVVWLAEVDRLSTRCDIRAGQRVRQAGSRKVPSVILGGVEDENIALPTSQELE